MPIPTVRPATAGSISGGTLEKKATSVPVAPAAVEPPIQAQNKAANLRSPRTAPSLQPHQTSQSRKSVAPIKMYCCHWAEPSTIMVQQHEEAAQEINPAPLLGGGEGALYCVTTS